MILLKCNIQLLLCLLFIVCDLAMHYYTDYLVCICLKWLIMFHLRLSRLMTEAHPLVKYCTFNYEEKVQYFILDYPRP